LLALLILVNVPTGRSAGVPPSRPDVVVTGTAVVIKKVLLKAIGKPPRAERRWARWARAARTKVIRIYKKKGYRLARAWYDVNFRKRAVTLHIDEGRIDRIEVRGGGLVARLSARREMALPHGVYHRKTVRQAMKRLKAIPALQNAYIRVVTIRELVSTPLGNLAPKRILRVFAVTREPMGLSFAAELTPRFGLGFKVGYAHPSAIAKRDRLAVDLSFAAPVRRYYYETEGRVRWVGGGLALSYRLHPDPNSDLALGLRTSIDGQRDSRRDVGWRNVLDLIWRGELQLIHMGEGPFILHTGLGAELRQGLVRYPDPSKAIAESRRRRWQLQWRTRLEIDVRPTILRLDDANRIWLDTLLAVTPQGQVAGRVGMGGRAVVNSGPHQFRAAFDGFSTLGTSYFQDMEPVAGDLQKAFFGGRFWTHRMARLELGYRGRLNRFVQLGLVHDLTVFEDRSTGTRRAVLINAVGPTGHLSFLGLVAVDVGYSFGFVLFPGTDKLQWSHNLNFRLSTVF